MINKSLVTTLDNLPILKQQINILYKEVSLGILSEIIVVNNGSIDGTSEWLDTQSNITVIHRENKGAGHGRNAGINIAGDFDRLLLLDGGIRPLINGTERMLNYMNDNPYIDVLGLEIPDMVTDESKAWRRWPDPITKSYRNTRLSHTAYCLAKYKAFDGIRFCTEGPFGEAGHGCDDDELAYQWKDKGIIVHVVTGVHPYRRASGSHSRLFQETGIWPNQYGSVYEKRLVWLQQNYPAHQPGVQWGLPETIVSIDASTKDLEDTIKTIKMWHDKLRQDIKWPKYKMWKPYQINITNPTEEFLSWAQWRSLRQHHGNTTIINNKIIKRFTGNEMLWTGDFTTVEMPWLSTCDNIIYTT